MSSIILTEKQARVLGAMIEKQYTTPLNYPMTPNSIKLACNQKSNRDPVCEYTDDDVFDILQELEKLQFVSIDSTEYSRTSKYRQDFAKVLKLETSELVILCELFNRGPQTQAELRTRCERMHRFRDPEELGQRLQEMANRGQVRMLERLPGTKEQRWAHLFSGEPVWSQPVQSRSAQGASAIEERIGHLEAQLSEVLARLMELEKPKS